MPTPSLLAPDRAESLLACFPPRWQEFESLQLPGIRHGFTQRGQAEREDIDDMLLAWLGAAGYPADRRAEAEQTHGNGVAVVEDVPADRVSGVDALITKQTNLPLVIRVADCGPVFFYDTANRAIGLAHSGRKGTEANIAGETISAMQHAFGTNPADLVVQLGPCIRPPHYEVEFARTIGDQAREAGVVQYYDCQTCTASDLGTYYSYRAEKGTTGRMWAVLMLVETA